MARRFSSFINKFPISRGMIVYAVLWPTSDLCRQLATKRIQPDNKDGAVDIKRLARFSLFGSFWVAPTVFTWVKISTKLIPGSSLGIAALKAFIEQFTYGPFSIICFYFGMNLLENKSAEEAWIEVKQKFLPTWKTGVTFWPIVQTFNFAVIPERNRVIFVGLASFVWTTYLSFMEVTPFSAEKTKK